VNPLLLDIPDQLTTTRLLLRRYHPGDGRVYFQAVRANRSHLYEFLPPELMSWQMRQLFICGTWDKEAGTYIGETYLANPDWQVPCIELGYFLLKEHTGKGFATEAARSTIRFAFEYLKVTRIELQCSADNQASINVARRCGFQEEGCFRQRHHKKDGTVVDRLWYGLLLSEWQATPVGEKQPPNPVL
jgi:RimJ/RimL family protein N-acetyltransferase